MTTRFDKEASEDVQVKRTSYPVAMISPSVLNIRNTFLGLKGLLLEALMFDTQRQEKDKIMIRI